MSSLANAVARLPWPFGPGRPVSWPASMSWLGLPPSARDASPEAVLAAYAALPADQALGLLQTHREGLPGAEADVRRVVRGPNILPTQRPPSWILTLLAAIPNPFSVLLIFLAIINASVPDRDWAGITVLLVMVFISVVRFWQEYRSSLAVFRLQSSITNTVKVRRPALARGAESDSSRESTTVTVMERDVVPGDIVVLSPGCIVPADCLILDASFLRISQSSWTGENDPVLKVANPVGDKEATLFDLANLVFMGISVVSGNGVGLVLRTGRDVLIAGMAKELKKRRERNAFEKGIRNVSWMLVGFMCVMVPIVLVILGTRTKDWNAAALFSISVAVGLVPEMLPAIVNTNLAHGAFVLSKMKAIVKRLDSVQNVGAMSILCSDKDEITLSQYLDYAGAENVAVLKLAKVDAHVQGANGNNIDLVILNHRLDEGKAVPVAQYRKVAAIPFTFEPRRSSCIVRGASGQNLLICKGAFDEVLGLCTLVREAGFAVPLNAEKKRTLAELWDKLSKEGYRVLLIAEKQLSGVDLDENGLSALESCMTLEGVLSFVDPPKDDAAASIAQLKALGVQVKVLTGDSLPVALNVCQSLRLAGAGDEITDEVQAFTGPQLAQLEDTPALDASQEKKALVVGSLRKNGHCVGMLGEGINDCMALRKADAGISVDSGASVAKDCADLILTEKGLGIIVASVKMGRITHGNTVKYIKMVASSNFGNVFSILAASAWVPFQPILSLQLLAQNLLYDISQIAIPWDRVDSEYMQRPRSWNTLDLLRFVVVLGPTSSVIDILTFVLGWFYYGVQSETDTEGVKMFRAHWFMQGLLTHTLIVHMLRTAKVPFIQSRCTVPLALSTASIMVIGFSIPWIPPFKEALGFARPALSYVGLLVAELVLYCPEVQAVKMIYVRIFKTWL